MICGEGSLQAEATVVFTQSTGDTRCHTRTLPVQSPAHKVLTAPYHPQADRRTHANKKLAGSISRTSHLHAVQAQGDLHDLASAVCLGLDT
jgi:hypothetical protein